VNKEYALDDNPCELSGKRAKYFEYVFKKAKRSNNLIGIMIDTWNVDEPGFETSLKDTPAEETIKEFFKSWN